MCILGGKPFRYYYQSEKPEGIKYNQSNASVRVDVPSTKGDDKKIKQVANDFKSLKRVYTILGDVIEFVNG